MSWVDHAYARVLRQKSRLDSPRRWRHGSKRDALRVDYGYETIPDRGQFLSGGLVKVQDLQTRFPHHREQPNVLYLVSSALPHDAEMQARAAQRGGGIVVLNQNGVGYPGWHGAGWEKFNRQMKYIHHLADYVVYQSQFCQDGAEQFLGARQGAHSILYNPVDAHDFMPAEVPPVGGPILLLAGTHQFQYRVDAALKTLASVLKVLPEARLRIAGQHTWTSADKAKAHIDSLSEEMGIQQQVDLLPPYAQTEAPEMMRDAHILLHTKYQDPCPRLVVEAMACGLPIVFSATGGMPEVVGPTGGLGVEGPADYEQDHPPEAAELAQCVVKIWQDYSTYRQGARQRVLDKLDLRPWLQAHAEIFESLLKETKG
ncbi:glycosyltransferase family 4 protein [Kiritimatiellota bacterium B12222]|nr:glycosyltransferase family 4 protein [Kiritimatiellota bacterium B12222]